MKKGEVGESSVVDEIEGRWERDIWRWNIDEIVDLLLLMSRLVEMVMRE